MPSGCFWLEDRFPHSDSTIPIEKNDHCDAFTRTIMECSSLSTASDILKWLVFLLTVIVKNL